MANCLAGLGSNLGDRAALLDAAVALLQADSRIQTLIESRRRETSPIGGPDGQLPFLNSAVHFTTDMNPDETLQTLLDIENKLGRERKERWAARVIDIDLLLYDKVVVNSPRLQLPHPRMMFRRFVLEPAAEIAADMNHPTTGWTVARLLENINTTPIYIAVTGTDPRLCSGLARQAAAQLGARLISCHGSYAARNESLDLESLGNELAKSSWPDALQVTLSDFWWDELLKTNAQTHEHALHSLGDSLDIVTPTLLVRIEDDATKNPLSFPGPVLNLPANDPAWALAEIIAAALAMQ